MSRREHPLPAETAPTDPRVLLSPDWLSAALNRRVEWVEVVETRADNIATKIRFRILDSDGESLALCLKAYLNPDSAKFAYLGQFEYRFYRDLAAPSGIECPRLVYGGIDPWSGHGLIIMEDLVVAGCTFLSVMTPYSPDQTASTLAEFAKLHHTDPARSADGIDWLEPRLGAALDYIDVTKLQSLLEDGRSDGLPLEVVNAQRLRSAFATLTARGVADPNAVIHADCHAGNVYLTPSGRAGLIDWQVLQRGPWYIDVAYHISAVLEQSDREAHERELLDEYLATRRCMGDSMPSSATAWDLYRGALVYGWYMWAITYRVNPDLSQAFSRRLGAAAAFHDTLGLLGA
jgi:hypothetical protein